ncbi:MAG: hypothetical protein KAG66_00550 [Methylococcales bacterium]|nr:hypothetical protein [Methylococcales bacterium]
MAIKASTGLRNGMMVTNSFKSLMGSCTVKIYGGPVPADADAAIDTAVLLCEIFNGNDGATTLTFADTASDGVIQKNDTESWSGTVAATGTATFYRLELAADDQASSTTHLRLQGSVGVAGADMNLSSVALVLNAPQNLGYYSVVLPNL